MKVLKMFLILTVFSLGLYNCKDHHEHKDHDHKKEAHHDHGKDDHHHEKEKHEEHHDHDKDHDDHDHEKEGHEGHHHDPLHKAEGAGMKAIGDHFAHIEMVLKEDGKLILWITDGGAENAIRIKQKEIKLKLNGKDYSLSAVANSLTGEKVGDTSQFEAQIDDLKGKKEFEGEVIELHVKGKEFKNIQFHYPLDSKHKDH